MKEIKAKIMGAGFYAETSEKINGTFECKLFLCKFLSLNAVDKSTIATTLI